MEHVSDNPQRAIWRRRLCHMVLAGILTAGCSTVALREAPRSASPVPQFAILGLSGEWEISDGDLGGSVTLDCQGTGHYEWQQGTVVTTGVQGRYWSGTWHQTGNDREGGFEVVLSDDRTKAEGRWWYSRIGEEHYTPSERGGPFDLKRPARVRQASAECTTTTHDVLGPL